MITPDESVRDLNGQPYFIDWQTAMRGPFYIDLPHHHCTLTQAEQYRQALASQGYVISRQDFAERYRVAARYADRPLAATPIAILISRSACFGINHRLKVAVRKAWQRRGIARSLMIHALNALQARGMAQVRLFTDADDGQGARSLYERVGFCEVKQHIFYRKPFVSETL